MTRGHHKKEKKKRSGSAESSGKKAKCTKQRSVQKQGKEWEMTTSKTVPTIVQLEEQLLPLCEGVCRGWCVAAWLRRGFCVLECGKRMAMCAGLGVKTEW